MKISSPTISLLLALSLLLPATAALAETRYIADQLVVNLRSGTGDKYQSLENLATDSPLEVLKEEGRFVQVRTKKGNVGYIPLQYVNKTIPKPIQISELTRQVAELQTQLENERQEYQQNTLSGNAEQQDIAAIRDELKRTKLELEKVASEYKTLRESAADVLNLMTTNETQTEEIYRLSNELAVLQKENNNFHRSNMVQWFLAGGAVFFCGWLIGKISRRKRGFERF